MESSRPDRVSPEHAGHDRLIVARLAMDESFRSELGDGRGLVQACDECGMLAADVRLLSAAVRDLPVPARPRDFRLSTEQAEKLRGTAVERFLRRLAAPGLTPLRPLAGVALSIGLALAVVGTALPTPVPSDDAVTDAGRQQEMHAPAEAAGGEPEEVPALGNGAPAGAEPGPMVASGEEIAEDTAVAEDAAAAEAPLWRELLIYAGLVLALLSLALLLVVSIARRRWLDPLLR